MANLTSTELDGLNEQLGYEDVLIKKYSTMASQCDDPQIKSTLEAISHKHQRHFDQLFTYLR